MTHRRIDLLPGSCFVSGMGSHDNEPLVTVALVQALRLLGLRVAAMTPLASDGVRQGHRLTSAQLEHLGRAGSFGLPGPALSPYLLPAAPTPVEAVQRAGLRVDVDAVVETYEVLSTWADAVVVQGVGGLCVPLSPSLAVHDVAGRLALPLVLALRVDADAAQRAQRAVALARSKRMRIAGWVATDVTAAVSSLVSLVAERAGITTLGVLAAEASGHEDPGDQLDLRAVQQALLV